MLFFEELRATIPLAVPVCNEGRLICKKGVWQRKRVSSFSTKKTIKKLQWGMAFGESTHIYHNVLHTRLRVRPRNKVSKDSLPCQLQLRNAKLIEWTSPLDFWHRLKFDDHEPIRDLFESTDIVSPWRSELVHYRGPGLDQWNGKTHEHVEMALARLIVDLPYRKEELQKHADSQQALARLVHNSRGLIYNRDFYMGPRWSSSMHF